MNEHHHRIDTRGQNQVKDTDAEGFVMYTKVQNICHEFVTKSTSPWVQIRTPVN